MPARSGGILIYCERTGAWAAALRREPGISSLVQRQTRSLAECREALAEYPASLVVLEITSANLEKALDWLCSLSQEFPRARAIAVADRGLESRPSGGRPHSRRDRAIAVADRGLESHQWLVREFGCLAFTTSPRELTSVAQLIERYFAALPVPEMSVEAKVWAELPW